MSKAVSFSRLMTYKKCPANYEWQYVLGNKEGYEPGPAAQRGTRIHNSIEATYLGTGELDEEIPPQMVTHIMKHHGKGDWIFYPEYEFALTKDWEPCEFNDEHAYIRGFMDNLLTRVDKDNYVVEVLVDEYKTGGIYDEHDLQKQLYAMVAMILYPDIEKVTVTGVYIDKKKLHTTEYIRSHLFTMKYTWQRDIAKLDVPIYPARPGFHCRWCPKSKKKEGGTCPLG